MTTKLIESNVDFVDGDGVNTLTVKRYQDIPQEFLDGLAEDRKLSTNRAADFHKAASIPAAVHELWLSQGYDCTKEPVKKTLAKLRTEGLEYFIATEKRL
jgi:hypothetical protein